MTGTTITFENRAGETVEGYLAAPDKALAGVVVLQEWWGLNAQIRSVADRLSDAGFAALAPDLYRGRVTGDPDEANHLMEGLDWIGATETDVAAAVDLLGEAGHKVGVLGFCMGGALAVIAAARIEACAASVCYYGLPPADQARPSDLRCPFQGHFADDDDWCTPAAVDAFESGLDGSTGPNEIHRYPASHGFFNETIDEFDPEEAARSWDRAIAFLRTHLETAA